jgi:2'-5' RNA ligase superfamily
MVHSVELLFDPDTESAIRSVWQRLSDSGLRSPPQTSRPHATMVVAERIAPEVDGLLSALMDRFPFPAVVGAPMVFGRSPLILVRLLVPSAELLSVHAEAVRISQPHAAPAPAPNSLAGHWTPHVTLARRVDPSQLAGVLTMRRVSRDIVGSVVGIRRWDGNKRVEYLIS